MGLAASQARFLAITSRKASCELQSQQIAQQRLSLSRDMEDISQTYYDALNQTNLVWDPDGSGDTLYDLSYGLMMEPSDLNDYTPYMLSRSDGKIALNSKMAAAAKAAGIPDSGFSGSATEKAELFAKFIEQMQGNKAIKLPPSTNTLTYVTDAGLGGELLGKEVANNMGLTSMISYIDTVIDGKEKNAYAENSFYYKQAEAMTFDFSADTLSNIKTSSGQKAWKDNELSTKWVSNGTGIYQNGTYDNSSFTIADLLNNDITLWTTQSLDRTAADVFRNNIESVIKNGADNGTFSTLINKSVEDWYPDFANQSSSVKSMLKFFDQISKGMYSLLMPDNPDNQAINAYFIALNNTIDRLCDSKSSGHILLKGQKSTQSAISNAQALNCWSTISGCSAISLSNLTEAFLTDFVNGMNNFKGDYQVNDTVKNSYYITDDASFIYTVNTNHPKDEENEYLYLSEFYSVMFNNLCQNGWYENEYVDDNDYINNSVKNGQMFVVSKGSDNYFYQERYVNISGGHIMENTDQDAITNAEREYTSKKNKINYKDEQLEIEAKQLDAEISALSTEYDTVKSLISKNIEKTFTLFNN